MSPPLNIKIWLGLIATAGIAAGEPNAVQQLQKQLSGAQSQIEELSHLMQDLRREMKTQEDDLKMMRERALKQNTDSRKQQLSSEKEVQELKSKLAAAEAKIRSLESQLAVKERQLLAAASANSAPSNPTEGNIPPVFFGLKEEELQREYARVLKEIQQKLAAAPATVVRLTGHSNLEGSDEVNLRQSALRAESLAKFLESRGIARKSIQVVAAGSSHPLHEPTSKEGRLKNRRVEIVLVP